MVLFRRRRDISFCSDEVKKWVGCSLSMSINNGTNRRGGTVLGRWLRMGR